MIRCRVWIEGEARAMCRLRHGHDGEHSAASTELEDAAERAVEASRKRAVAASVYGAARVAAADALAELQAADDAWMTARDALAGAALQERQDGCYSCSKLVKSGRSVLDCRESVHGSVLEARPPHWPGVSFPASVASAVSVCSESRSTGWPDVPFLHCTLSPGHDGDHRDGRYRGTAAQWPRLTSEAGPEILIAVKAPTT